MFERLAVEAAAGEAAADKGKRKGPGHDVTIIKKNIEQVCIGGKGRGWRASSYRLLHVCPARRRAAAGLGRHFQHVAGQVGLAFFVIVTVMLCLRAPPRHPLT